MKNSQRILLTLMLAVASAGAFAQDKLDMFNPVNTSVTSQMIAPDARAPVWVMSVWLPTLMSTRNIGTLPSILSV